MEDFRRWQALVAVVLTAGASSALWIVLIAWADWLLG